jgi:3alpha(or 20beta)-hydroxysteroid dehydrogenase
MLKGKTVLITGAARGIGAAIARRVAALDGQVVLTDVLENEGQSLAASIGKQAMFLPLDVVDESAWTITMDEVLRRHGALDVLVNNAAVLHMGTIEHTSAETFRRVVDVNATGAFLGIKAVVEPMKAAGGGSIINVTSVDSLLALNGLSAYVTSKWGLRGLSKSAAIELGRSGIRVNCVCPTSGNPEMFAPWADRLAEFADEIEAYGNRRADPLPPKLEEIAEVVVFLASEHSRFITGADIPVDGGHTAGTFLAAFNEL